MDSQAITLLKDLGVLKIDSRIKVRIKRLWTRPMLKYPAKVFSYHMIIMDYKVGDEVFLKSILNSTETVARGRVQSLDPNELVGGTEIGPEWCEVNV
ncbi:putative transposase, Tnp1/En/Spm [Helianthus annuus]|nr:putative transposase, Tnp1/En/Spm [Helianthus annuus]KAJ0826167.1 putative transposase, Tnp1/En/Spm [Helianthus annuus]